MYREAVAEQILEEIAVGNSLQSICRRPGMPPYRTVVSWVLRNYRGLEVVTGRRAGSNACTCPRRSSVSRPKRSARTWPAPTWRSCAASTAPDLRSARAPAADLPRPPRPWAERRSGTNSPVRSGCRQHNSARCQPTRSKGSLVAPIFLHRYDVGGAKPAITSPPGKFRMQTKTIFLWPYQRLQESFIIFSGLNEHDYLHYLFKT